MMEDREWQTCLRVVYVTGKDSSIRSLVDFSRRFYYCIEKIVEETEPKRKRKKRFRRKERSKGRQCEESCKTKNLSFTDYDLAKFRRMFFIDFLLKNIVFLGILLYL